MGTSCKIGMAVTFALAVGLVAGCPNPSDPVAPLPPAESPKTPSRRAPVPVPLPDPAATAGYRSHPDLPPNPADPFIDPDIRFEEVALLENDFGNGNGFICGTVRYDGPDPALPYIEIRAFRCVRTPGGGWEVQPVSVRQAIVAIPKKKTIDFRLRLNCRKSEIKQFIVVGYNPDSGRRPVWVALRASKPEEVETDLNGNDLRIMGSWTNDSAKTVVAYKVQVDLIDSQGQFLDSVGTEGSFNGIGEPFWAPGTTMKFAVSLSVRNSAGLVGCRAEVRAVGRVK